MAHPASGSRRADAMLAPIPALLAAASLLAPAWSAVQVERGVQVSGVSRDRMYRS
jgi:hypothetical protein